jgi:hypothetical protein
MPAAQLKESAATDAAPPDSLTPEQQALWLAHRDWEAAHNIAQDIPSADGSWLHALLHLIEGDTANAHYWYARAGRTARGLKDIADEWDRLARHLCGG